MLSAARRVRLAASDGFTTVVIMGVLLVSLLLIAAAFEASDGGIGLARAGVDGKAAYAAAEAGVNDYAAHLNQDSAYWTRCDQVPPPNQTEPNPVNQPWNGSGPDPRRWRTLPAPSSSQYTIELLPANGSTCTGAASMLAADGTFQIRSTGRTHGIKRSLVATFRPRTFLDYLYLTDYETQDPATILDPTQQAFAKANCIKYAYEGRSSACTIIRFGPGDSVAGSLHSNDQLVMCGTPTFGRNGADAIETSAPSPGWVSDPSCGQATPNFLGTFTPSANRVDLPSSNAALQTIAGSAGTYTGTTYLTLSGDSMSLGNGGKIFGAPIPPSGVVYIKSSTCAAGGYSVYQYYTNPAGCGDVYVQGTASKSVTIVADNDIIIDGNVLTSGTNTTIGLIANNFVRIYHPVTYTSYSTCNNNSGTMQNVEIDAAILALNHSLQVDNWFCGGWLGTLTVKGAIAQKFRGIVGTASGGVRVSGYAKNYTYDNRLAYSQPPWFLSPLNQGWILAKRVEQHPAR